MIDNFNLGIQKFDEFASILKGENRFFIDNYFLRLFDKIIDNCVYTKVLNPNDEFLFRGRINPRGNPTPYTGAAIGMPSKDISKSHGRANPYGINYMYLSNNPNTVIAELRPNIKDYISIGKFKLTKTKKVIWFDNFSVDSDEFLSAFILKLVHCFSKPVDINNKELEYIPSQYFAEYCKKNKYDGVVFLSSLFSNNFSNYNYVFFSDVDIIYESTDVHFVEDINYSAKKL